MGQACSVEGASCANTPRGSASKPQEATELHQAAAAAAKLPGALSTATEAPKAACNDGSKCSTGDKKVSIGPVVTAVLCNGTQTTQAIKAATAATEDPAVDSPASHADTPSFAAMPAVAKPFVDDESLLTPVAEEALSYTASPDAAVEAPAPGNAGEPGHHADEHPPHSAAPNNSSSGEHQHHERHHSMSHQELVQQCEQHAPGTDSKRSSVADGAELRSTTSGQLNPATEHSMMSIASASDQSSLTGEAAGGVINDEVSQSVLQGVPSAAVSRMPTSSLCQKDSDDEDDETPKHDGTNHTPTVETLAPPMAEASKAPSEEALTAQVKPAVAVTPALPVAETAAAATQDAEAAVEPAAKAGTAGQPAQDAEAAVETAPEVKAATEPARDAEAAVEMAPEVKAAAELAYDAEAAVEAAPEAKAAAEPARDAEAAVETAPEVQAAAEPARDAQAVRPAPEAAIAAEPAPEAEAAAEPAPEAAPKPDAAAETTADTVLKSDVEPAVPAGEATEVSAVEAEQESAKPPEEAVKAPESAEEAANTTAVDPKLAGEPAAEAEQASEAAAGMEPTAKPATEAEQLHHQTPEAASSTAEAAAKEVAGAAAAEAEDEVAAAAEELEA